VYSRNTQMIPSLVEEDQEANAESEINTIYFPLNPGLRFSRNACRASRASSDPCRIPPAFEVITIVVSMELSRAARMIRLLIHYTIGGVRMMRSHSARVVSSSFSNGTR
jgi:hypothetical protein